jgi:chemotaxis methyl-accepting protein methylase
MDITFDHYDAIINELRGKGIDLHLRTETILKRKFEKFFAIKNLKNIDQFYQNTSSADFLTELSNFIITDKTEIFRFPDSWNFIRSYAEMKGANHNFSIFIPNCASGEDIISFAIMFDRLGFKNWHIHADTETEEKLIRSKKLYFEES